MSAIVSHLTNHHLFGSDARPFGWSRRVGQVLGLWASRIRDRQRLMHFDDRELRELGVSRWEVEHELAKHFWQE